MSESPHERPRRHGDDRHDENRPHPLADYRRGYDSLHPNHTTIYRSTDATIAPESSPHHSGMQTTKPRDHYDGRRQLPPSESFLSQLPLGNNYARDARRVKDGLKEYNVDRHERHPNTHREDRGSQDPRNMSVASSGPYNSHKRPAPSPSINTEHEIAMKRQRQHSGDASSMPKSAHEPIGSSAPHTLVKSRSGLAHVEAEKKKSTRTGKS